MLPADRQREKKSVILKVGQIWAIKRRDGRHWTNAEVVEVGTWGVKLRYLQFPEFLEAQPGTLENNPASFRLVTDVDSQK